MRTPKGRMFRLLLPDGSAVWLNAASSIRYPTAFTGQQRRVEVTGEAYFEVAHQPQMPFRVSLNGGAAVEVLGTHFNVNAYAEDEQMNITLLEGAVQCSNGSGKAVLKPGQQARMTTGNSPIRVMDHADIEKVMAWKNGLFNFNDASLEEVMRQLERWYDIEVRYEKGIPRIEFIGKMDRSLTLAEVLAGLEMSKVHFRIEGERKLVILP
jgi:ferric-dicitrate binding protein FerR (iron transport regulator)